MQVRVITVQSVTVTVLEHRGDPALLKDSVQRFIAWRRVPLVPAWNVERST
jgi:DNA gyrase inhibitor GyrI